MTITIGIDVGGTKIAAGVVDAGGAVIARRRIATQAADPQAVVAGIVKVARELSAAAPAARAVGIGAAGLIDVGRGLVVDAPNIAWRNVPLRDLLGNRTGLPVFVDNDANVAAWAEAVYGAGRGAGDQATVTVGTGIGGGLVINGAVYRGAGGVGAELGHMVVAAPDGPLCACGNVGCLEAVASGTAIGRAARERAKDVEAVAVLERAGGDAEAITGAMVGAAAAAGDPFARGIVADAGRWLGVGLLGLVHLLDPEVVVVGGGVAAGCGELLIGPAREFVMARTLGARVRRPVVITPAALGDDAGIVGAAALARSLT